MDLKQIKLSVSGISAFLLTFINYFLGGWDKSLEVLCTMMILDFISGILKAIANKELSSKRCGAGCVKKVCYFVLIMIGVAIDSIYNTQIVRNLICYFFIATDAISILENIHDCGVPYPKFLSDLLIQLKKDSDSGKDLGE